MSTCSGFSAGLKYKLRLPDASRIEPLQGYIILFLHFFVFLYSSLSCHRLLAIYNRDLTDDAA